MGVELNSKGFPEIVVRQWCFNGNFFFADRMDEVHGMAQQGDTAIGITTFGAIFEVALDGTTYLCQLAADLVVASCLQIHLQ